MVNAILFLGTKRSKSRDRPPPARSATAFGEPHKPRVERRKVERETRETEFY